MLKKIFFLHEKKKKYFLFINKRMQAGDQQSWASWTIFPEDCTKRHSELAERSETFHSFIYKLLFNYSHGLVYTA